MKAEESYQVQKARKKLQRQFEKENKRIDEKALIQMKHAIQIWIKRHARERVALKGRPIQLFDENKHPAATKSRFVRDLITQLKGAPRKETSRSKGLAGRIKKEN